MSKICPETGEKVVYLTCLECDTKTCMGTKISENLNNNKEEKYGSNNQMQ